jgi:hypothetical protein
MRPHGMVHASIHVFPRATPPGATLPVFMRADVGGCPHCAAAGDLGIRERPVTAWRATVALTENRHESVCESRATRLMSTA